ncbi:hypothetical protein PMAYCL1PPCAC_01942, partial [Pristionchus mayeri]
LKRVTEARDNKWSLTVRLGDTLKLVLLLDGVAVGGSLGGVDQLISKALSDGLDATCLVDTSEGRHVDGLTTDGTGTSDTGRVFTGSRVDDLERVLDNADGHELLSVVASVHHQRACKTLNDGGVGKVLGVLLLDGDVVDKRDVPLSEELDLGKVALNLEGGSDIHGLADLFNCPLV